MPQAKEGPDEAYAGAAHQRGGGMEAQVQVPAALSVVYDEGRGDRYTHVVHAIGPRWQKVRGLCVAQLPVHGRHLLQG